MTTRRRRTSPKKATPTRRAPRITGRHITTAWLTLTILGTGAWYALINRPAAQDLIALETNLIRAENRLRDNEQRVNDLNTTINDLTTELNDFINNLTRADPYTTDHQHTPTEHLTTINELLQATGLTITTSSAPEQWNPTTTPTFHTANLTIAATGTYQHLTNALTLLERGGLGTRVSELLVGKIGGDPDDPILDIRLMLDVIARERLTPQEN